VVTITGSNFGIDLNAVKVLIDNIPCAVSAVTDTSITCTTGNKGANNFSDPSLVVKVNDINSLVPDGVIYYYGLLWSNDVSWGLEAKPREGDSVWVPKGKTIIVDESTPIYLNSVVVEGTIIFADLGTPLEFHAKYFIIRHGQFIAGIQAKPYTSELTITLYGNYWDR